jgi:hypothetical protein
VIKKNPSRKTPNIKLHIPLQLSQNVIPTKEYLILRGSILQFASEPKQEEEGGGRGSVKLSSSVDVAAVAANGLLFWHPQNVAHPTQRCNSRMKQRMILVIMTVQGMHHSTKFPFCFPTSRSSSFLSSNISFKLHSVFPRPLHPHSSSFKHLV